jgi:hypothetical protein
MNAKGRNVLGGLCALHGRYFGGAGPGAQAAEVKEKPPMYTYVSNWIIPRARWAEMDKASAADDKIVEKAIASGTLVAYGEDWNLVHQRDDNIDKVHASLGEALNANPLAAPALDSMADFAPHRDSLARTNGTYK